ncbi:TPA: hypothetical protein L9217_000767 [Klebsiella aerogenes]|nr:hypothetical protein [Klebsiella aerogenes]
MSVKIVDDKRAWDRLVRELEATGDKEVVVGIQQGATNDGLQVAEYATWNEFGTRTIPSRPFMRSYFDSSIDDLTRFSARGIAMVISGRGTMNQFFNAAGVRMVNGVKKSINNGAWVPNSLVTIALKGSDKPLIDTGVMLNSVAFAIHKYGDTKA